MSTLRSRSSLHGMLRRIAVYPCALSIAFLALYLAHASTAGASNMGFSFTPSETEPYAVCGAPVPQHAECMAIIVPSPAAKALFHPAAGPESSLEGGGIGGGFDPEDLQSAYAMPSGTNGSGQTVAIVDAYDDPNAESDLTRYRSHYGLPECITANGCFKKVNQSGGTTYPAANASWAIEISLDLDMVSAACPKCHIDLVEATTNSFTNLDTAEEEAVSLGATGISNSWGATESEGDSSLNSYYDHLGIPITFSAGDHGYEVEYPAASPDVIAVGGTRLIRQGNPRGWEETAWSGTGSGCSAYETKPEWQHDTGCSHRTNNDVSAVASSETPVSVADSYALPEGFFEVEPGWTLVAGTSVASPLVSGVMALSNSIAKKQPGAEAFYEQAEVFGTGVLDDVVSGSNGSCGNYLCNAGQGYDGPTGLGSPWGAVSIPLPEATTEGPTQINQHSAVLHGSVNPNDLESHYYFEYGPTNSYGTSSSHIRLQNRTGKIGESLSIGELLPNRTYHYRIVITNNAGTVYGADEQFTAKYNPIVHTETAANLASTKATFTGMVNPEGAATTYWFEYWPASKPGEVTDVPAMAEDVGDSEEGMSVSQTTSGLQQFTQYKYRLVAENSGGRSYGSEIPIEIGAEWGIQSTPNPSGAKESELIGVSCVSSTECEGVGYYKNSSGAQMILAERWNGSEWSVQSTPTPSGAEESFWSSVSCWSATRCEATGYYKNSSGTKVTLAEGWNGTEWVVQSTPNPNGAKLSTLHMGVSCASMTACTAVGYYENSSGAIVPLAERWNGTEWAIQSTPIPSGATTVSTLQGVSCVSTTWCMASGYELTSSGFITYTERWNGTEWSVISTPDPSGAKFSAAQGISCPSSSNCTFIGFYENSSGTFVNLAERWNGTEWAIQSTPNPVGAQEGRLGMVSCTSASACTAVGWYKNSAGTQMGLAEQWNGTEWTIRSTPSLAGATLSSLSGISCTSSTACATVGAYKNSVGTLVTLAELLTPEWSVQSTPNLAGAVESSLSGLTCTSSTSCYALGSYRTSTGKLLTLAEKGGSGSEWTTQTTPNPSGAKESEMLRVSCVSSTECMGVGYYRNSSGIIVTLAQKWNGSEWSVLSTPNPSGAQESYLSVVSCLSSNFCEATGYYKNSSGIKVTLAEKWNGTEWVVQSTPNPSGAKLSTLHQGVSCTSTTSCVAVGYYENSAGTIVTLAEQWNGSEWAIMSTPNPSGSKQSTLQSVDCLSSTFCDASGYELDSEGTFITFAEQWNGTEWSLQTTPDPSGAIFSAAGSISCTSTTACTFIGFYENSSHVFVNLAERWNGSSWVVQSAPNPSGAQEGRLMGVSCTSATACEAVGYYKNSAGSLAVTALQWNGTEWTIQSTPSLGGAKESELLRVSCLSTTSCEGVGTDTNSSGVKVPLAEKWNGTEWSAQPTSSTSGAQESYLSVVSCVSSNFCEATGYYKNGSGTKVTLAEKWNGTEWSLQSTPNPSGARFSTLHMGVSCTSSTACTAVGYYENSSGVTLPLAERWNGTEWSIQSTPSPSGATFGTLQGVSCTSTTNCMASGYYGTSSGPDMTYAEKWNGSEWSLQTTPDPSGATFSAANGIWCSSSVACTFVGFYRSSSGTLVNLAERWNGSEWSIQSTPNPSGAQEGRLNGVSCTSSASCTAAGWYKNSSGSLSTIVEQWDGTEWSIEQTPTIAGSTESILSGVSCVSATACTALGSYRNSAGVLVGLAETQ